jgi:hypothetical protein
MPAAIVGAVRGLGPVWGLAYLIGRLVDRLSRGRVRLVPYVFVAQPVPGGHLTRPPRAGSAKLYRAAADDPLVASAPRPADVIQQRFRDGAHCFVAAKGNELAGFIWIKERFYLEDEVRCLYRIDSRANAVWDFDVFVKERHRGGRLFAQLWDFANVFLREHGYCWTFSRISAFNRESLAAHQRLGGRIVGRALFVVLGPVQLAFLDCRPYVHLSLHDRAYPTVRLAAPATSSRAVGSELRSTR